MLTPDEHAAEALAAMGTAANMIDVPERALVYAQMATTYALLASRPTTPDNGSEMGRGECGFCSGGPVVNAICPWHGNPKSVADELRARREHFDGPDRMELVRELREAVGLSTAASSMPPRKEWQEALDRARHLAELSQGAVTLAAHEVVRQERDEWERETTRVEQHRDGLHAEVLDLRWLVGHLARNAPDTVMLPPRLAPLVKECMDGYDPSCYTLAEPVPSTGEDQAAPDSARARAGMTVVHKSGSRHVLSRRKEDDSGWWLADKGGVADWILDSDDWQLIFEPVPDEGSKTDGE